MRISVVVILVSPFMLAGTVCGDTYVATDTLMGGIVAAPLDGSGGDYFVLPIEVTLDAVVDLDSFQSITFTDARFTATPAPAYCRSCPSRPSFPY